jgi:pyruvate,water dikinase
MKRVLKGLGVSQGKVKGKVKIIKPSQKHSSFHKGDILVTRITDPTMITWMAEAGAIICDIGGMTSHPSIVSREMGIPCVVATKKATKVLKNNMSVVVDGTKGIIYSL